MLLSPWLRRGVELYVFRPNIAMVVSVSMTLIFSIIMEILEMLPTYLSVTINLCLIMCAVSMARIIKGVCDSRLMCDVLKYCRRVGEDEEVERVVAATDQETKLHFYNVIGPVLCVLLLAVFGVAPGFDERPKTEQTVLVGSIIGKRDYTPTYACLIGSSHTRTHKILTPHHIRRLCRAVRPQGWPSSGRWATVCASGAL